MQEIPHINVVQGNIVKQFNCHSRGISECKHIQFLVQFLVQMYTPEIQNYYSVLVSITKEASRSI